MPTSQFLARRAADYSDAIGEVTNMPDSSSTITRTSNCLQWPQIVAVAEGAPLSLSAQCRDSLVRAREAVDDVVARGIKGYGINTGIGAKCNDILNGDSLQQLSKNLIFSHATGVGPLLGVSETRAIIAVAVNNLCHGHSGISPKLVDLLLALLNGQLTPEVPEGGSVGYLSHMAHVGLACLGEGFVRDARGERLAASAALRSAHLAPAILAAKDGLSLINGTPCATGLACVAISRMARLLNWADCVAAMTFENLKGQAVVFDEQVLMLRASPGIQQTGAIFRSLLQGSTLVDLNQNIRTQDALSLRAIPQVHGAVRDALAYGERLVNEELASTTDNPVVVTARQKTHIHSEAHGVAAGLAMGLDHLAVATAHLALISERRQNRLLNATVSGLPAFLAEAGGEHSGFMIAQYASLSLVNENRRLAAPASLDGGTTSALQEDYLSHATPSAVKLLQIIDNSFRVVAIELLMVLTAYRYHENSRQSGGRIRILKENLMAQHFGCYKDDVTLSGEMEKAYQWIFRQFPTTE